MLAFVFVQQVNLGDVMRPTGCPGNTTDSPRGGIYYTRSRRAIAANRLMLDRFSNGYITLDHKRVTRSRTGLWEYTC